jgi:probable phosphoglycerate mutase
MTRILLARHGHVEGIQPERFRGRAELALTAQGVAEAEALARRIARQWQPEAVYTSPLQRCVVTGTFIANACGLKVMPLQGLMDIDYGDWQMRRHDDVKAEVPQAYRLWKTAPERVRFPNGESLQDLLARTADVVRLVLDRHDDDDIVVLVGHDSVNRAILMQFLDQPMSAYWRLTQDPCCLNEIVVQGTDVRIERINDTCHLEGHLDRA